MPPPPTDIIQSFWLRFWRESSRNGSPVWRGMIWHEQQGSEETAVAMSNPEAAFEFIRAHLQKSPLGTNAPRENPPLSHERFHVSTRFHWRNLMFWRRPR